MSSVKYRISILVFFMSHLLSYLSWSERLANNREVHGSSPCGSIPLMLAPRTLERAIYVVVGSCAWNDRTRSRYAGQLRRTQPDCDPSSSASEGQSNSQTAAARHWRTDAPKLLAARCRSRAGPIFSALSSVRDQELSTGRLV